MPRPRGIVMAADQIAGTAAVTRVTAGQVRRIVPLLPPQPRGPALSASHPAPGVVLPVLTSRQAATLQWRWSWPIGLLAVRG